MTELKIEVPDELELGFKELSKEEINLMVSKALREKISERLMFKVADELLKDSKITDELALKWGSELKERVAKRHGL
ncbi:hypothetical protein HY449_04050 [Candidatus Pacearchaeota archaeon]|nr:hypothetical protein [Candidatus Pacearchaeota archaeon]